MPTALEQIRSRVDDAIAQGKIPAQEREETIQFLSKDPNRAEWFSSQLAGGSYFTRKAQEEAEKRRQWEAQKEAERQAIAAQRNELEAWSRDARAEVERARAIQEERDRLLAQNAKYQQLVSDFNLRDQLEGYEEVVEKKETKPVTFGTQKQTPDRDPETGRFISRDEGAQAFQEMMRLTSKLGSIQARHQQLFGQPLTDSLIEEAMAAGSLDKIEEYWANKYNVGAKEAELQARRQAEYESKIREEERQKLMAELAINPSQYIGGNPGYQPSSSPLADAYMNSRAASMNPVAGTEGTNAYVPPEKRSDLAMSRERVAAGATAFNKYFNIDGTPRAGVKPPKSYVQSMYDQDNQ